MTLITLPTTGFALQLPDGELVLGPEQRAFTLEEVEAVIEVIDNLQDKELIR